MADVDPFANTPGSPPAAPAPAPIDPFANTPGAAAPAPPSSDPFATTPGAAGAPLGAVRPTTSGLGGLVNAFYAGLTRGGSDLGTNIHVALPVLKYQLGAGDPAEIAAAAGPIRKQQASNEATLAPELPSDWSNPSYWSQQLGEMIPGAIAPAVAGPVLGAAGAALGGPPGGVAGLAAGLFGAGAMTTNATAFLDYLQAHGVDTTSAPAIQAALTSDPALGAAASSHALVQSGVSGLFNLLFAGTGRAIGLASEGISPELAALTGVTERAP